MPGTPASTTLHDKEAALDLLRRNSAAAAAASGRSATRSSIAPPRFRCTPMRRSPASSFSRITPSGIAITTSPGFEGRWRSHARNCNRERRSEHLHHHDRAIVLPVGDAFRPGAAKRRGHQGVAQVARARHRSLVARTMSSRRGRGRRRGLPSRRRSRTRTHRAARSRQCAPRRSRRGRAPLAPPSIPAAARPGARHQAGRVRGIRISDRAGARRSARRWP